MNIIRTTQNHSRENKGTFKKKTKKRKNRSNKRGSRTTYQKFRKKVLVRDHYQCVICGKYQIKGLRVHHIYSWQENRSLRFDVDNAITLCADCHDKDKEGSFHAVYGNKDNDIFEFAEYYEEMTGHSFTDYLSDSIIYH